MIGRITQSILLTCLLACAPIVDAQAQRSGQTPAALQDVGVDERLGQRIPLDIEFRDERGETIRLDRYFDGERPVVLTMTYHDCPMLCNLILDAFTKGLKDLAWTPGGEFDILSVSFAANETPEIASGTKERYLNELGRPEAEAGWHFLTGDDASIEALASAVGFKFKWVEQQQDYAHPAVLIFLSGEGVVTRYLYGLEYPQRQLRNALVEAGEGNIGTTLDQVILYCFQYDSSANSYVLHATNLMKLGGMLTVLLLGSFLFILWRRERRNLEEPAPHRGATAFS